MMETFGSVCAFLFVLVLFGFGIFGLVKSLNSEGLPRIHPLNWRDRIVNWFI